MFSIIAILLGNKMKTLHGQKDQLSQNGLYNLVKSRGRASFLEILRCRDWERSSLTYTPLSSLALLSSALDFLYDLIWWLWAALVLRNLGLLFTISYHPIMMRLVFFPAQVNFNLHDGSFRDWCHRGENERSLRNHISCRTASVCVKSSNKDKY
jgi:hypothetical protein